MLWQGWRNDLEARDPGHRVEAAFRLGDLGKDAWRTAPALADRVVEDDAAEVRSTAAWALGRIQNDHEKVLNALVLALGDQTSVRESAVHSLVLIRGSAVQALTRQLLDEESKPLRASICTALSKIGVHANEAAAALMAAAADDDEHVRAAAIRALGRIGERARDCAHVVSGALHDTSPHVRLEAAAALKRVRGDTDARVVVELLSHPDTKVRVLAAATLREISD